MGYPSTTDPHNHLRWLWNVFVTADFHQIFVKNLLGADYLAGAAHAQAGNLLHEIVVVSAQ